LESRNDNIEFFEEHYQAISEKNLDALLANMKIEAGPSRIPTERQCDTADKTYPHADFNKIVEACSFMQHWKDKAASLGEPAWYAGLTIVARCINGQELAHKYSQPHPEYSSEATKSKIQHALQDSGPLTCRKIKEDPSINEGACEECLIGESDLITSPINLGAENLLDAQHIVEDLLAAPDKNGALLKALESPNTLGNLALVADQERGKYEAFLMKLREEGVLVKDIARLERAVKAQRAKRRNLRIVRPEDIEKETGLPRIKVKNRQLRDVAQETLKAIIGNNDPPEVFQRGGEVVRVHVDEESIPFIQRVGENAMQRIMSQGADFVSEKANGQIVNVLPPKDVANFLLSAESHDDLPPLVGVVESPTVRPDGSIINNPGYDPSTGLYYKPEPNLTVEGLKKNLARKTLEMQPN
jgi:hypothetical protein